jgi:hypothetical protein
MVNMVAAAVLPVWQLLTAAGGAVAHQFLQRREAAAAASTTREHRLAGRAVQLTLGQRVVVEQQAAGWQAAQGLPETSLFAAVVGAVGELMQPPQGLLVVWAAYRVVAEAGVVTASASPVTVVPVPVVNFVFGGLCNESTCH